MNLPKLVFVNWKTTATSSLLLLAYLIIEVIVPKITGADVDLGNVLTPEIVLGVVGLTQFLMGLVSRDYDKSSQDNSVRPKVDIDAKVDAAVAEALGEK